MVESDSDVSFSVEGVGGKASVSYNRLPVLVREVSRSNNV